MSNVYTIELERAVATLPALKLVGRSFYDVPLRRLDAMQPGSCCIVSSFNDADISESDRAPLITVLAQQLSPPELRGTGQVLRNWSVLRFVEFCNRSIEARTNGASYYDVTVPFDVGNEGPLAHFSLCPSGRYGVVFNALNSNCAVFAVPTERGVGFVGCELKYEGRFSEAQYSSKGLETAVPGRKITGFPSGYVFRKIQWHPIICGILVLLLNREIEDEAEEDSSHGSVADSHGDLQLLSLMSPLRGPFVRTRAPLSLLLVYDVTVSCCKPLLLVPLDDDDDGNGMRAAVDFSLLPSEGLLRIPCGNLTRTKYRPGEPKILSDSPATTANHSTFGDLELRILWLSEQGDFFLLHASSKIFWDRYSSTLLPSQAVAGGEEGDDARSRPLPTIARVRLPVIKRSAAGRQLQSAVQTPRLSGSRHSVLAMKYCDNGARKERPVDEVDLANISHNNTTSHNAPSSVVNDVVSSDSTVCWFCILQLVPMTVVALAMTSGHLLIVACTDRLLDPTLPVDGASWITMEELFLFQSGEAAAAEVLRLQPLGRNFQGVCLHNNIQPSEALIVTSPKEVLLVEIPWLRQLTKIACPVNDCSRSEGNENGLLLESCNIGPVPLDHWPSMPVSWVERIFNCSNDSMGSRRLLCGSAPFFYSSEGESNFVVLECTMCPVIGFEPSHTTTITDTAAIGFDNWDTCDSFVLTWFVPRRSSSKLDALTENHAAALLQFWNLLTNCCFPPYSGPPRPRRLAYLEQGVETLAKAFEQMLSGTTELEERISLGSKHTESSSRSVGAVLDKLEFFGLRASAVSRLYTGVKELQEAAISMEELDSCMNNVEAVSREFSQQQYLLEKQIERSIDTAATLTSYCIDLAGELSRQLRQHRVEYITLHCYNLFHQVLRETTKLLKIQSGIDAEP